MSDISAEEVARVDFIHAELDKSAKWYLSQHVTHDGALFVVPPYNSIMDRVEHEFTAAEVRDWPRVKAELVEHLKKYPHLCVSWSHAEATLFVPRKLATGDKDCAPAVARGLCLYATSRAYLKATGQAERREADMCRACDVSPSMLRASLCEECHVAEKERAERRVANGEAPYEGDRLLLTKPKTRAELVKSGAIPDPYFNNREKVIAYNQHREDDASGRRAHLIAQLAAELSRPAPVRYPHEGRSERVYQPRVLGGKP
jgi:hypothetical protein